MKKLIALLVILVSIGICVFACMMGPLGSALVVQPHIQMPAERIPLGPISLPNSMVATLITDLILVGGALLGTRLIRAGHAEALVPKGLQNFVEWIYDALSSLLHNVLGEKAVALIPLLMTFFLFILFANWIELFPGFDSIGVIEEVEEGAHGLAVRQVGPLAMLTSDEGHYTLVPFLRAANTDLNTPLALSLVSVFMIQFYGVRAAGWGYFYRFFNLPALVSGGIMKKMDFVVGLLEGVGEIAKIVSFAFRLFGNIFAGMVLLLVISSLAPFLAPVAFYFLELFVGAVQALVFMMLTAAFIAIATMGHGDHH